MEKKASHWRQWNEVEVVRRYGGEGGIRTPGRSFPLRRFSKPLLSTTQPPLREMHMVLKGILPHRRAGIEKAKAQECLTVLGDTTNGGYPAGQTLGQTANFRQTAPEIHVSPGFAACFRPPPSKRPARGRSLTVRRK